MPDSDSDSDSSSGIDDVPLGSKAKAAAFPPCYVDLSEPQDELSTQQLVPSRSTERKRNKPNPYDPDVDEKNDTSRKKGRVGVDF